MQTLFLEGSIVRQLCLPFVVLSIETFCLFRFIGSFLFCAISESDCLTFNVMSFSWYLFCYSVKQFWGPLEATFSSWILSSGLNCARELRALNLKHNNCCFHQLQTFFCGRQLDSRFLSFWLACWGGPKLKSFAVNVERQRRKIYRQIFAKKVAIRSPSLFFYDMGGNLSAEIFQETPVTVAKFRRNTGNRRYFPTEYRRFCDFFRRSAVIVENLQPKFRPGIQFITSQKSCGGVNVA